MAAVALTYLDAPVDEDPAHIRRPDNGHPFRVVHPIHWVWKILDWSPLCPP